MSTESEEKQAVHRFTKTMNNKLRKNCSKRHWRTLSNTGALFYLEKEVDELRRALMNGDLNNIMEECADVANFAMMLHDNAQQKILTEKTKGGVV